MERIDLTGDGRSDLLVTSPWGLGVASWNGSTLTSAHMTQNGTRIGEWLLDTAINASPLTADVNGDGLAELLLTSPWGIGFAAFRGGAGTTVAMAANGTRVGGWIIDTASNRFLHALDADGDGRDEVLVTSPWGIGLLALRPGGLTTLMLAPNGTRFGGWLLSSEDNWFPLVADLDGDGRDEIVVTSPWGLGILRFDGTSLTSIAMIPNGTDLGGFVLDTAHVRVESRGDFDADGRQELVLSGPTGLAIVALSDGSLRVRAFVATGDQAGEWTIDPAHDSYGVAADVDGDGRDELVVTSDWGLGVLGLVDGVLRSERMVPNGTRIGEWLVNTRDNSLVLARDVDGDGAAELIATSPWGLGVLRLRDAGASAMLAPNGTRFGGWLLDTAANDWLAGVGRSWAVVVHQADWGGVVPATIEALKRRGYNVLSTDVGARGVALSAALARAVAPADRVFVYLAGHGAGARNLGDFSRDPAFGHRFQFNDGALIPYRDFAPSFELMADKGAQVSVIDGSCDGGETVVAATGERYVAISTTSVWAPGLTNTPNPADVITQFGRPARQGMWWTRSDAVSRLSGRTPHRFYQKAYRNDDTPIARWSPFYKPGIHVYAEAGWSWTLMVTRCWLWKHVYNDIYRDPRYAGDVAGYEAGAKISTEDYIVGRQAAYDAVAPSVAQLRSILADAGVRARAAKVYAGAFPRPWQTVVADLGWDIDAAPRRELESGTVLEPGAWRGEDGFHRLVVRTLELIADLERSWPRQIALLRRLDAQLSAELRPHFVIPEIDIELRPKSADQLRRQAIFEQNERVDQELLMRAVLSDDDTPPWAGLRTGLGGGGPIRPSDAARVTTLAARPLKIEHAVRSSLISTLRSDTLVTEHLADSIRLRLGPWVTWLADRTSAELIAEIRANDTANWVTLDLLHYLLGIVEEAVSRAQETGAQPGDLVSF